MVMNKIEVLKLQQRCTDLYGMMVLYQTLKNPNYNTIINVGSFTGKYSNVYSRLFKNVISFDPSTHVSINKYKSSNETFYNKALYSEKTKLKFYQFPKPGYDSTSKDFLKLNEDVLKEYQPKVSEIETYMLDEFNFDCIDYIKIDAEGVDGHVILGAEQTIKKCRPVIQVEYIEKNHEAVLFLLENNYTKYKDNMFLNYGIYSDDMWIPNEKL
jgi:FkbM family methyltransferase